ncbi:MAG: preprotein translocase subunit SecE [Clostridia bacterium]|nr:preprotein translocase subunit SecE [Clostridia bacterium]
MSKKNIAPQTSEEENQQEVQQQEQKVVEKKAKKEQKQKKAEKKAKKQNNEPKRNRVKETFSELKKVTWPTFGKTMAQTGMVIGVVALFALFVFGVDALLSWLFSLING